jgi:chemotaxis protein MotB
MQNLKETNRRLKEANDRLVAETNRLEEEIAKLHGAGPVAQEPVAPALATGRSQDLGGKEKSDLESDLLIDDSVQIDRTSQGIRLRIPDRVFFSPGQVKITSRGEQILHKVAQLLNNGNHRTQLVRVDGHTDDTPIRKVKGLFPTNWELSTARACTVVRYLVEQGNVNARRIFPAGFSYYRPVTSGSSVAARGQNRRVEITILNESV